jgi:hypothetical protein
MSDFFYRFRPASYLLDGFHELERQEIYFPTLRELNDPLEGYKDLIWRGDRIVWRNLFKHYLLCLMQSVALVGVAGRDFTTDMSANLVYQTESDLPLAPVRDVYTKSCTAFFGHPAAEALLTTLSREGKAIRRDELTFYLRLVHMSALANVLKLLGEHGLNIVTSIEEVAKHAEQSLSTVPEILRVHAFADDQAEVLFFINKNLSQQMALINELIQPITEDHRAWVFLVRDFASHYVEALERLMYPDWHAACFVTDPTSAAMWGHYAAGHQGMCLKFRAKPNSAGVPSLDLNRATSWRGDGSAGYSYVPHAFEAIDYTSAFPQIDFFESLGRLPIQKLRFWYDGHSGERSEIGRRVLGGDEKWREEYWQRFVASYRTKLPHWAYEDEHRIVFYSNLADLTAKESRKPTYRFEDLAGIVFGLKTSSEDKIAAMRIIERKCVAIGRTDFEFWQTHYAHHSRQIELAQLRLIRISPGGDPGSVAPS